MNNKQGKQIHFEGFFSGPSRGYHLGQVKVWGCRHRQQNMKMNISEILWFDLGFVTPKENARKKNNRLKSKEHNKGKYEKKQWNATTAKKKNITTKVRKQGWLTHLQTTRYMKTKGDHEETKWEKKTSRHETTKKKPCFSLFWGHPFGVPKILENNLSAKNTDKLKIENTKIGKTLYFPWFSGGKIHELIRGLGGGGHFLIDLGWRRCFWTLFFGSPVS